MRKRKTSVFCLTLALLLAAAACGLADSAGDFTLRQDPFDADDPWAQPCGQAGTIECVTYATRAYALEAYNQTGEISIEKTMYVYLPSGYDENRQYPVLILMHGGMEEAGYWFGLGEKYAGQSAYAPTGNMTQRLLDHMIAEGRIEPLIVVTPSFYSYAEGCSGSLTGEEFTDYFWIELKNDIMPYIRDHYAVHAAKDGPEGLTDARDYQAYCGLSQGGITAYHSVLAHCTDLFSWVGICSAGDIRYSIEMTDGRFSGLVTEIDTAHLEEACAGINSAADSCPIHFLYHGCGDKDPIMFDHHRQTYNLMLELCPDALTEEENTIFHINHGTGHDYRSWILDLHNVLLLFFRQ